MNMALGPAGSPHGLRAPLRDFQPPDDELPSDVQGHETGFGASGVAPAGAGREGGMTGWDGPPGRPPDDGSVPLDRLEALFEQALRLPPEDRERFLDEHVGSDPELRRELSSLLAEADSDPDFLDRLSERVVAARSREALLDLDDRRLADALGDRYRLRRRIGRGGMATVYLADDLRHERQVAVKVLQPELAAAVGAGRFLAEIRTTANLQHPHILPLFDSGEAGGFLYYVMPYVEGESLRERLERERKLPVDDAVRIATEVADALEYAHRHGVVHRDLKPGNVLLHEGRPRERSRSVRRRTCTPWGAWCTRCCWASLRTRAPRPRRFSRRS